jgi:hypothetical protein
MEPGMSISAISQGSNVRFDSGRLAFLGTVLVVVRPLAKIFPL